MLDVAKPCVVNLPPESLDTVAAVVTERGAVTFDLGEKKPDVSTLAVEVLTGTFAGGAFAGGMLAGGVFPGGALTGGALAGGTLAGGASGGVTFGGGTL